MSDECSCHKEPRGRRSPAASMKHISAGLVLSLSRRPVTSPRVRQSPNSNTHTTSPTGPSTQCIQTSLPSPLPFTATWKRLQRVPFVALTFPIHVQRGGGAIQYMHSIEYPPSRLSAPWRRRDASRSCNLVCVFAYFFTSNRFFLPQHTVEHTEIYPIQFTKITHFPTSLNSVTSMLIGM